MLNYRLGMVNGGVKSFHCSKPHTFSTFSGEEKSLSQYLQEIGRAGRRGQPSNAIIYCNKQDVAKNLPGI